MITWCRRENGVTSLKLDILPGYWLAFDTQIWIHRISLHKHEVIDYLSLFKGQLIRPVNVISHIAVHTIIYYETWIIRLVLPSWPVNLRWYSFLLRSVWNLLSVGLTRKCMVRGQRCRTSPPPSSKWSLFPGNIFHGKSVPISEC